MAPHDPHAYIPILPAPTLGCLIRTLPNLVDSLGNKASPDPRRITPLGRIQRSHCRCDLSLFINDYDLTINIYFLKNFAAIRGIEPLRE